MTSPYRRSGARPTEEPPAEEAAPRAPRDFGRRISSHARIDLAAKASAVVGEEPGVDLHMNGLVLEGLLGKREDVLFSEIDQVFYRFEGDEQIRLHVSFVTFEGLRVEIPPVTRAEGLVAELDREVGRPLVVPAREALACGEPLFFGPLVLELGGIVVNEEGRRTLPWSGLPRVIVGRAGFAFHMPDTHGRFAFLPLGVLPHPRVLVDTLRMRTRVVLHDLDVLRMIGITPERGPSSSPGPGVA